MAQLKDTVVTGDLSVTGTIHGDIPVADLSGYTGTSGFLKMTDGSWSLSTPETVASTSVKGNAETTYRTGEVNLTPANLGISATTSSVTVGSTTFNKYTHPTGAGNNHIPSGGSNGQFLGWSSTGTAAWVANPNTDTKVTQAAAITTAGAYPVLLGKSTATTAVTDTVNKTSTLNYNPSTKVLKTGLTTTANAIAVYTDTGGALGTKATAKGAAYATAANGALTFGTLPIAEGGTGNTTGTATLATTAADTTNELITLGVTSGATTTLKRNTNLLIKSNTIYPPAIGESSVGTSAKPFFKGFFDTALAIRNTSDSGERGIYVENTNGSVSLKVASARGLFDGTDSEWMLYKASGSGSLTRTTSPASAGFGLRNVSYGTDIASGGNDGDIYVQYDSNASSGAIASILGETGKVYFNYWDYSSSNISTTSSYTLYTSTIPLLPKGTYLLMGGGGLFCSGQTARLCLYINSLQYSICMTNSTSSDRSGFGVRPIVIDSDLTNPTLTLRLMAQTTSVTAYLGAYEETSCVLIRLSDGIYNV